MPHITCENCGDKFYDSRKSCPNCSFERTDGKGKEVDVKSNTKKTVYRNSENSNLYLRFV